VAEQCSKDTRFAGRATQQRNLVLSIIERADRHLDADEIYARARKRSPNISLSTVYRNLQLFKEQELVEEHQFDGVRRCYERVQPSRHHHMVCLGCGRIFEFTCPATEKIRSRLSREKGFVGYCPDCQRRLKQTLGNKDIVRAERR